MLQNTTNSPWKDSLGRWHVRALFKETSSTRAEVQPRFTTNDDDIEHEGVKYVSLKKRYMEFPHVPGYEYEFSETYLGGWEHWERLVDSSLRDMFKQWRAQLTIKQKAKALRGVIEESTRSTPTAFQASKYLVEEGWIEKKGRPKKEDVERAANIAAGVKEELEEDLARVGLKVVK